LENSGLENNSTADYLRVPAQIDPKIGDVVQWEIAKIRME